MKIVQIAIDEARADLYALSDNGDIYVWDLTGEQKGWKRISSPPEFAPSRCSKPIQKCGSFESPRVQVWSTSKMMIDE